jgi:hypothetical protein
MLWPSWASRSGNQSGDLRRSEDLVSDVADAFTGIEDPAERVRSSSCTRQTPMATMRSGCGAGRQGPT